MASTKQKLIVNDWISSATDRGSGCNTLIKTRYQTIGGPCKQRGHSARDGRSATSSLHEASGSENIVVGRLKSPTKHP